MDIERFQRLGAVARLELLFDHHKDFPPWRKSGDDSLGVVGQRWLIVSVTAEIQHNNYEILRKFDGIVLQNTLYNVRIQLIYSFSAMAERN